MTSTIETFCDCGSATRRYGLCLRCGLPEGPKAPEPPAPRPPGVVKAWVVSTVAFTVLVALVVAGAYAGKQRLDERRHDKVGTTASY